jgi:hypothetical protein
LVKNLPAPPLRGKSERDCSGRKALLANPIKKAGADKLKDQYPSTSITALANACGAS